MSCNKSGKTRRVNTQSQAGTIAASLPWVVRQSSLSSRHNQSSIHPSIPLTLSLSTTSTSTTLVACSSQVSSSSSSSYPHSHSPLPQLLTRARRFAAVKRPSLPNKGAMSQTATRPPANHDHTHPYTLQPSAMPRPPPSPAVDVNAPASAAAGGRAASAGGKFDLASKLNRERDGPGPGRTVLGRVNVNAPQPKSPMPAPDGLQKATSTTAAATQKSALSTAANATQKSANANTANTAVAALQRRAARPPLTTLNAANLKAKSKLQIPRPAAEPDVFAPDPPKALGKRARESQPATASVKRSRADPVKALQYEQEQWLAKWQRAFPTLTFHFEIGADDGAGRGLKARVAKLGAVSRSRGGRS